MQDQLNLSSSELKQNPLSGESQEYLPASHEETLPQPAWLQDYLIQLQSLQQSRFYLSDQEHSCHQFRMTEICSSDLQKHDHTHRS